MRATDAAGGPPGASTVRSQAARASAPIDIQQGRQGLACRGTHMNTVQDRVRRDREVLLYGRTGLADAGLRRLGLAVRRGAVGGPLSPAVVPPEETTHPIWGEDPQEFQAIFVRKTFTLDAAATANIIAGADDDYDLFINGVFIGGNHDGATNLNLYTNVPLQAGLNALAMKAIDVVGGCQWLAFDVFPPPVNDELSGAPEPGTMVYDPTPVPDGPAGTFSFIADLCNIGTKQLTELTSVTTTLTGGNVLLNRDSGTPPNVGSELTFPANRGYADQILDPDECVGVPFTIGLQEPTSFQFFVDVMGVAAEP
jgi:hypothetical protein